LVFDTSFRYCSVSRLVILDVEILVALPNGKEISAGRRPVKAMSAMPRVVKRSEPSSSVAVAMKASALRGIRSDCS
jgi:hypothetical protein